MNYSSLVNVICKSIVGQGYFGKGTMGQGYFGTFCENSSQEPDDPQRVKKGGLGQLGQVLYLGPKIRRE